MTEKTYNAPSQHLIDESFKDGAKQALISTLEELLAVYEKAQTMEDMYNELKKRLESKINYF